MVRFNMKKNHFVLRPDGQDSPDSLTRDLDLNILARGYGEESRGVPVSYQAAVAGAAAWCFPAIRRVCTRCGCQLSRCRSGSCSNRRCKNHGHPADDRAFVQAGVPRQAVAIYPELGKVGAANIAHCP